VVLHTDLPLAGPPARRRPARTAVDPEFPVRRHMETEQQVGRSLAGKSEPFADRQDLVALRVTKTFLPFS